MGFAAPVWRTGRRRESTIPRLLDAGIEVLLEKGHTGCTPEAVAARARVAPAAVFHHFGTLNDFRLAVAEEVACRRLVRFQSLLDTAPRDADPLETALTLLADLNSHRTGEALLHLMAASRTDPALADRLAPLLDAYRRDIQEIAVQLPGLAALPPGLLAHLIQLALDLSHGVALRGGDQEAHLPLVLAILRGRLATLLDEGTGD